jgi:hypothetical protein
MQRFFSSGCQCPEDQPVLQGPTPDHLNDCILPLPMASLLLKEIKMIAIV